MNHTEVNQWGFTANENIRAYRSTNLQELKHFSRHSSRYIRATVARNPAITEEIFQNVLHDESRGVRMWALSNPALTRIQFHEMFKIYLKKPYCDIIHPALAEHPHATTHELIQLSARDHWNIHINILNNHVNRDHSAFKTLISRFLEKKEKANKDWEILRKIAYLRTYGHHDYSED